ncbi:GAF domain-containing protein [Solimonas marina]|uniref:GAF domain-containing protein n=1 Tax=Solimonas marina TaxID=2714601 RepID=A0A969W6N2_9GAMM|nr:GAF domain-containing protein [Solimonas marina]NKF21387.1 GAF domain-containing protein [Solimonas marina]
MEAQSAGIAWAATSADDAALGVLQNTLRSACGVVGARGGFVVQLRDDTVIEISCAHALAGHAVFEAVLGSAAAALRCALLESRRGLTCAQGELLEGCNDVSRPAVVSLPLELGTSRQGAICLLRSDTERVLSDLDFEILDALADQAALALGASCQRNALNRLEASLNAIGPQSPHAH